MECVANGVHFDASEYDDWWSDTMLPFAGLPVGLSFGVWRDIDAALICGTCSFRAHVLVYFTLRLLPARAWGRRGCFDVVSLYVTDHYSNLSMTLMVHFICYLAAKAMLADSHEVVGDAYGLHSWLFSDVKRVSLVGTRQFSMKKYLTSRVIGDINDSCAGQIQVNPKSQNGKVNVRPCTYG